jgi:hypothetical protein
MLSGHTREWLYLGAKVAVIWTGGGVATGLVRSLSDERVSVETEGGRVLFRVPSMRMVGAADTHLTQLTDALVFQAQQRTAVRQAAERVKALAGDRRLQRLSPDIGDAIEALQELRDLADGWIARLQELS